MNFELDELSTLIVGIIALEVGARVRQSVPFLRRIDMPNAVVGAMIVAVLVLIGQIFFEWNVTFGSRLRDGLLLIFFTSIGLSAKLSALKAGGKPLADPVRRYRAGADGPEHRGHDTRDCLGSASRPMAYSSVRFPSLAGRERRWHGPRNCRSTGLENAQVVAVGAATLAVITGALVSGPVTGFIIKRHELRSALKPGEVVTFAEPRETDEAPAEDPGHIERLLASVLVIAMAVFIGEKINDTRGTRACCFPASCRR